MVTALIFCLMVGTLGEIMLSSEILEAHYQEYGSQPDSWVENMAKTKYSIVQRVFDDTSFNPHKEVIKVAVLGASDKRYIPIHQKVFSDILRKEVSMVTLDIDTDHLANFSGTLRHDVTLAFPDAPYDLVFSHALLKFLTPEEQFKVVKNSFDALGEKGMAMHIIHAPELNGTNELRQWQHRVDIESIRSKLREEDIPSTLLHFESDSVVEWLRDTTVLVLQSS